MVNQNHQKVKATSDDRRKMGLIAYSRHYKLVCSSKRALNNAPPKVKNQMLKTGENLQKEARKSPDGIRKHQPESQHLSKR
jgi:hypothetical protein